MRTTAEQREYAEKLRSLMTAAGMPTIRTAVDAEGWTNVPGRMGQVEWNGAEWATGEERLYVFTPRPHIIARLLRIPGIHRHQMGDTEARMWFPAHDVTCLREVLRTIRARVKRQGNTAALATARARRQGVT